MEKCKITNTERDKLLIKNVSNRPNAMATFGESKLDPTQTKDLFDRQFVLSVEKHNQLVDATKEGLENADRKLEEHRSEVAAELEEHAAAVGEAMAVQDEKISAAVSDSEEAKNAAQNAVEAAGNAVDIASDVKTRADAGEFKGEQGDPYVLTAEDIARITQSVIDTLPKYNGEVIDV